MDFNLGGLVDSSQILSLNSKVPTVSCESSAMALPTSYALFIVFNAFFDLNDLNLSANMHSFLFNGAHGFKTISVVVKMTFIQAMEF